MPPGPAELLGEDGWVRRGCLLGPVLSLATSKGPPLPAAMPVTEAVSCEQARRTRLEHTNGRLESDLLSLVDLPRLAALGWPVPSDLLSTE